MGINLYDINRDCQMRLGRTSAMAYKAGAFKEIDIPFWQPEIESTGSQDDEFIQGVRFSCLILPNP